MAPANGSSARTPSKPTALRKKDLGDCNHRRSRNDDISHVIVELAGATRQLDVIETSLSVVFHLPKNFRYFVILVLNFQFVIREAKDTFALDTQDSILEIDNEDIAFQAIWVFLHIELHQDRAILDQPGETGFAFLPPGTFQLLHVDRLRWRARTTYKNNSQQDSSYSSQLGQHNIAPKVRPVSSTCLATILQAFRARFA